MLEYSQHVKFHIDFGGTGVAYRLIEHAWGMYTSKILFGCFGPSGFPSEGPCQDHF